MKKLIVLLFVLALVNVANAGYVDLQISSVGPSETGTLPIPPVSQITIDPSMWVDVDVVYYPQGDNTIWSLSKEMVITGPAEASIGGAVSTPGAPLLITWKPTWNPDLSQITILLNGNPLLDTVANDLGSVAPGVVLDHFLIHCTGPQDVTVALVENPSTKAGGSYELDVDQNPQPLAGGNGIVIHQPEPMTLTLLGLGSLFLARRKK
jgi:hypothetical protein